MTAHSPSAYSISVMLHGAFLAVIFLSAWALKEHSLRKPTEVFELVASEGDNWRATEATAYGRADATGTTPIAPPESKPAPARTERSISQQIKQIADRKERQIITQHRREEQARERREAAERAKAEKLAAQQAAAEKAAAEKAATEQRKTMTKEEFDRLNPPKKTSSSSSSKTPPPKIDTKGLATGVQGGKTAEAGAGGKALSRGEQNLLGTYFAFLKQKVRDAHVMPLGATDRLSARVSFHVSASGTISQVRIIRSSGNPEFDESVLAAFRAVGNVGARPDGRGDYHESEFNLTDNN